MQEALRQAICRSTATSCQVRTMSRLVLVEVGQLCGAAYMHSGCGSWSSAALLHFPSLTCRSLLHGDSCAAVLQVDSSAATAATQSLRRLSTTTTVTAQAQLGLMSLGQQPVPAQGRCSPAAMGTPFPQLLSTMASAIAVMERTRAQICIAHMFVFSPDLMYTSISSGFAVLCLSVTVQHYFIIVRELDRW